jgi:cell division transport system ATP-binding protein
MRTKRLKHRPVLARNKLVEVQDIVALRRKKEPGFTGDTVDLQGVGLRYDGGRDVVTAVSLKLPQKSFHFLTGASGAGKTSLLSLLYLAQRPSEGTLKLFGEDVTLAGRNRLAMMRRRLGVVFQDFRLLDHLSAFDNVALPLRVAGVDETAVKRDVTELLDWVGLADLMDARPAVLSGGQQQRVAIARAVINRPKLLLADEPTGNVDDNIAVRLIQLFIELHKLGTSVVVATHNEALTARFAFPRLHLEGGKLSMLPPLGEAG